MCIAGVRWQHRFEFSKKKKNITEDHLIVSVEK